MITVVAEQFLQNLQRERVSLFVLVLRARCKRLGFQRRIGRLIPNANCALFTFRTQFLRSLDVIESLQHIDQPKLCNNAEKDTVPRQTVFLFALADLLAERLELRFIRCAQSPAEQPTDLPCKFPGPETLMQRTNNLHSSGNFSGGFELAEAFVAGGNDLGKVLVEREGADISEESGKGGGTNAGA
jgi:hypothetical protein